MWSRLIFCFKNTLKRDTSCCNLITGCAYILLIIICIIVIFFGLVGIGKIIYLIIGSICQNNVDGICKIVIRANTNFILFSLFGILFLITLTLSIFILVVTSYCLYMFLKDPFLEMAETWHRSKHQYYENVNIPDVDNEKVVNLDI